MKKTSCFLTVCLVVTMLMQFFYTLSFSAANEDIDLSTVKSEYVLAINIDTGTILHENHSSDGNYCYCGFLPRIMTCAILLEEAKNGKINLSDSVTLTSQMMAETPRRRTETFAVGDSVSLDNLVRSILIANSQEACVAIAYKLEGSTEAFVKRLNDKAQELGMKSTTITNVHGYFDGANPGWTTLLDVSKAVKYALDQDFFLDFANPGKEPYNILVSGKKKPLYFSNYILSSNTSYYNKNAKGIAAASSDNSVWYSACDLIYDGTQRLVTIVTSLKGLDVAWTDINTLLKISTVKFKTLTVLTQDKSLTTIPVTRGKKKDSVTVVPATVVEDTVPQNVTADNFTFQFDVPESVKAPILKGDLLGTVRVYDHNGEYLTTVSLLAQTDVAANEIELFTDELNELFRDWRVWVFIGGVILIVLVYLIASNRSKSKRKNRSRVKLRR